MAKPIKHVGFKGAEASVEKEGYSPKVAAKIIGAGKAHASAAAKKANPNLMNTAKKNDNDADDKGSNYGGMARKGY